MVDNVHTQTSEVYMWLAFPEARDHYRPSAITNSLFVVSISRTLVSGDELLLIAGPLVHTNDACAAIGAG